MSLPIYISKELVMSLNNVHITCDFTVKVMRNTQRASQISILGNAKFTTNYLMRTKTEAQINIH